MQDWMSSVVSLIVMLGLIGGGVHIGYALLLSGVLGILLIAGPQVLMAQLANVAYNATASYGYVVIPLFILMGQFAAESRIGQDAFAAGRLWLGRLRGGLAMATIAGCGAFGAASGSTASTAALFARIAFPEMVRYGYDKKLASGCIAAAGTVAAMIPPSILLVLFGILSDQSIGKLLIGGICPGILECLIYMATVYIMVKCNPKLAPSLEKKSDLREKLLSIRSVIPIGFIFMFAIGGIFIGLFTPSEGGAIGAAGSFIVILCMRRVNWNIIKTSFKETAIITGMMFLALIGGFLFSRAMVLGGTVSYFTKFLTSLEVSPHLIFMGITGLLIVLGMIMQPIVIMLITVPILVPAIIKLGFDPIWFGIMFVRLSELAVITPPVAVNLYVVKGVLKDDVSLTDIIKGVMPFIAASVLNYILLYFFPQLVLWLPGLMYK
ncbi:MAG: TRAP transporter large permease subunit [bacterium]